MTSAAVASATARQPPGEGSRSLAPGGIPPAGRAEAGHRAGSGRGPAGPEGGLPVGWGQPPYTLRSLAGIAVAVALIMGVERATENGWVRVVVYAGILLGLEMTGRIFRRR